MTRGIIAEIWLACMATGPALGGAWLLPKDQGQAIVTTSRTVAPAGAHLSGDIDRDSNESRLFLEYGAWDEFTVGLNVSGKFATTDDDVEFRLGAHARYQLWTGPAGDVLSAQAGVAFPAERWLGNGLGGDRPQSATEIDLRVLYGSGWQWDMGNSFVSGEAALRIRAEELNEQIRLDVTAGHEPIRGVLALMSVFSTIPLGNDDDVSVKLAPSLAYTLWPSLGANDKKPYQPINPNTIQLGISWDAADRNSGLEIGIAIWRAF